uniref:Ig-like domain-containing protein n=1 Tax=Gouania willdenowi TaxID=441366 RepID=A0A8C5GF08_GOUWI
MCATGEAQVHTEVQAGPLYRVVGSPLSISCNVSGFQIESSEKQFQFIFKTASGNEINIISTEDDSFGYAVYQTRMLKKDIGVTRVSPNSVLFEIQSLQKGDEGEYHCNVVNSEYRYNGKYSAATTVKVIDNSLSVSSPGPTSMSFDQGDTLTLTCQAFSKTTQHTHLSFTWYLHRDGEDNIQPIISLDRDFTLKPGHGFEERYQAGIISLDKLKEATYKLKIADLEVSDQGNIYCQAQEWVQDPDDSWYPIAQMKGTEITVKVKASGKKQHSLHLFVSNTLKPEGRFFSVAWLRGGVELARIGPTGILSVGSEYGGREMKRELRVKRTGSTDYNLILQSVRTEDQGEYKCRAWLEVRGSDGSFTKEASVDSDSQLVSISATESELSLKMHDFTNITEGERLRLDCKVEKIKGQLSVIWQHKSTSAAQFTNITSLSQDGVIQISEAFTGRKVRAMRPAVDSFTLELDEVRTTDSGLYQCVVIQWKTNHQTHSQSQTTTVTVSPIGKTLMKVSLINRNSAVAIGDNVDLMCRIKGPRRALIAVTWSLHCDTPTPGDILTVSSDGAISWFVKQHRYQVKVETRNNEEVIYYLQIIGASDREAGSYCCGLDVRIENGSRNRILSNPVAVVVHNQGKSNLVLSTSSKRKENINTDIELKCSVTSQFSAVALYDVTWLFQEAENKTIVRSDRNAFVKFGAQMEPRSRQRISMRRISGPSFVLTIRQAEISDRGSYICRVEEWLQNPHGDWYQLSVVSKTTKLTITEPDNDLRLDKMNQLLVSKEAEGVEMKCDIISGVTGPSYLYKVTWFYSGQHSSTRNVSLVKLDYTGLLSYPEDESIRNLKDRLQLSRPSQTNFVLTIQMVREEDSGAYWCQVEQYQLDPQGHWKQKASDIAGPITLRHIRVLILIFLKVRVIVLVLFLPLYSFP